MRPQIVIFVFAVAGHVLIGTAARASETQETAEHSSRSNDGAKDAPEEIEPIRPPLPDAKSLEGLKAGKSALSHEALRRERSKSGGNGGGYSGPDWDIFLPSPARDPRNWGGYPGPTSYIAAANACLTNPKDVPGIFSLMDQVGLKLYGDPAQARSRCVRASAEQKYRAKGSWSGSFWFAGDGCSNGLIYDLQPWVSEPSWELTQKRNRPAVSYFWGQSKEGSRFHLRYLDPPSGREVELVSRHEMPRLEFEDLWARGNLSWRRKIGGDLEFAEPGSANVSALRVDFNSPDGWSRFVELLPKKGTTASKLSLNFQDFFDCWDAVFFREELAANPRASDLGEESKCSILSPWREVLVSRFQKEWAERQAAASRVAQALQRGEMSFDQARACLSSQPNSANFLGTVQRKFLEIAMRRLEGSPSPTLRRLVELARAREARGFPLRLALTLPDEIKSKHAAYQHSNGILLLDASDLLSPGWIYLFVHELAHYVDERLFESYKKFQRGSGFGVGMAYEQPRNPIKRHRFENWMNDGFEASLFAEYRAWRVTLSAYRESAGAPGFARDAELDRVIREIPAGDSERGLYRLLKSRLVIGDFEAAERSGGPTPDLPELYAEPLFLDFLGKLERKRELPEMGGMKRLFERD